LNLLFFSKRLSSIMSLMESPYGVVTFRQLTVMKFIDRFSVLISGLPAQCANARDLSSRHWFGAFGEISEIRVLRSNPAGDAHITYRHQSSVLNAISWCNGPDSPPALRAQNGYRKYCNKFLKYQRCRRLNCYLFHEWQPFADVMNQDKVRQLNPLRRGHPLLPPADHRVSPLPLCAPPPPPPSEDQLADDPMAMVELEEKLALQKAITETQKIFEAQQVTINRILSEIRELERENLKLRRQNVEDQRRSEEQRSSSSDVSDAAVSEIVDALIDEWPKSNE